MARHAGEGCPVTGKPGSPRHHGGRHAWVDRSSERLCSRSFPPNTGQASGRAGQGTMRRWGRD